MAKDSYKKKKKTGGYDVNLATKWQERYETAESNQAKQMKSFSQWYDDMYAVMNTNDYAPWRSKIFIPILSSKTWSLISKFLEVKPGFQIRVKDSENMEEEELKELIMKIQHKLAQDYDNPELDESIRAKLLGPLLDSVVCGMGVAKVPYTFKTVERYKWAVDEATGMIDRTKRVKVTKRMGYNDLIPVSIFNFFTSPSGRNFYDSPWHIIREFKTLEDLKATVTSSGNPIYKNLDILEGVTANADTNAQYSYSRNRMVNEQDPVAADSTVNNLEVFECYDKATGDIYTYVSTGSNGAKKEQGKTAKGWVEIRCLKKEEGYWHGKYPLVPFYIKKKPYTVWGEGIYEVAQRLQYGVNDVFNHYMDNFNLSVDGMVMVDEDSRVEEYLIQPGGELIYRGNPPQQFKFPEPNPNQVSLVMSQLQEAIDQVTISPYAQGSGNAGDDKTQGTATGIIRLQEAAGDIISFMRANFQESIKQVGSFWLSNAQQFTTQSQKLPISEGDKEYTVDVVPEDFVHDFELTIDDASMQPLSKQEQKEGFLLFVAQLLSLQKASMEQAAAMPENPPVAIDFKQLSTELANKLGYRSMSKFIGEGQMAAPPVDEGGRPPEGMPGAPTEEDMLTAAALNPEDAAALMAMEDEEQPVDGSLMGSSPLPPGAAGGLS